MAPRIDPATDVLWYERPASGWTEALPLGNGRLGAMVYGGLQSERVALNESTVWTGGPYDPKGDGSGAQVLPEIQKLVFEGKGVEAEALFEKEMMSKSWEMAEYQPLGDLQLSFPEHALVTGYRRELDLTTASTLVEYKHGGVSFRRQAVCSYPDQVIAIRLTADKPGSINFAATLDGRTNVKAHTDAEYSVSSREPQTIVLRGKTASYAGGSGLTYEARLRVVTDGGKANLDFDREHDRVVIEGANSATIYVAAATNFKSWKELGDDPADQNKKTLATAVAKGFDRVLADHLADYGRFYERTHLELGRTSESLRPTDERFAAFQRNRDPALPALLFHFGRYLLISSSREGSQPPNLQGLWNADMVPAWGGKLTTNINQEMNYWPVDTANLSDLAGPLLRFAEELSESGARTAKRNWNARGWVLGHNTDLWRATDPIHGAYWAAWHGGGAWLGTMLWDHYQFTGDDKWLHRAYPVMKGAAEFFQDTMVVHPQYGWLVTNPSSSPENGPGGDKMWKHHPDGTFDKPIGICAGPAMDNEMLREFFRDMDQAAEQLSVDADLRKWLRQATEKLPPVLIGRYGQVQEWLEDLDGPDDHHRHVSMLWGAFPGSTISLSKTPDEAQAVKVALDHRGDVASGWSMAWKLCLWARLGDGERAYKLLREFLTVNNNFNVSTRSAGGIYPNLLCCHPPFQIDGNFGATAGIVEMLLQSQGEAIELLPALPQEWKSGSIHGVKARGGFVFDLEWARGVVRSATIKSLLGKPCRLRIPPKTTVAVNGKEARLDGRGVLEFQTESGASYELRMTER
ncbi:MAG: glycoside hydrolase N-terminal domain-containing protein [Armatimonadetes bacterium]|nr:glycoside hydrolase N-terminal domain-containing protein [Armatimonadota bacterium]